MNFGTQCTNTCQIQLQRFQWCLPSILNTTPLYLGGVFVDTMLVVVRFRPPHISLPRMSPSIQKPGHASELLVAVGVAEVECVIDNLSLTRTRGIQKVRRLIQMDIINFADIVLLVSTVCRYNIAQLIIRRCFTMAIMYMRLIFTDGVAWSVCRSVTILSHAKTTEPIEMPFGVWTRIGARNHGSRSPNAKGQFWRKKSYIYVFIHQTASKK